MAKTTTIGGAVLIVLGIFLFVAFPVGSGSTSTTSCLQGCSTTCTTSAMSVGITISTTPSSGAQVGQVVTFTATPSTSLNTPTYTWSFGDGSTGTGQSTQHIYGASGTFAVSVNVQGGVCGTFFYGTASISETIAPATTGPAILVVTVVTAATNSPIQGASVVITGTVILPTVGTTTVTQSGTTNVYGQVVFTVVPGNYQVVANANGFNTQVTSLQVGPGGASVGLFMNVACSGVVCPQSGLPSVGGSPFTSLQLAGLISASLGLILVLVGRRGR